MMWRSSNTGELYFDDVRVPEENMLGERGSGFKQMMETLDGGRLSIGAMGLVLALSAGCGKKKKDNHLHSNNGL